MCSEPRTGRPYISRATRISQPGENQANTKWAFAKLEVGEEALKKAGPSRARERHGEFSAQGKANMVWAFGKLGAREKALMKDLSARAREGLEEFNAQHRANTARRRGRSGLQSLCCRSGLCSAQ